MGMKTFVEKTLLVVVCVGGLLFGLTASRLADAVSPSLQVLSRVRTQGTRGGRATRLTSPPTGMSDQNPAFSPDGEYLVFTRFADGYNRGPAGLLVLALDGGGITRLTPTEDQDNVNLPGAAWNALTNRIVFASDRAETDDLWTIAADGTHFDRLTSHTGLPWYIEPSWSLSGEWVVFEGSQPDEGEDGRVGSIWRVRADGSELTQLTGEPDCDDRQPNWSPTGDSIVFQRRRVPSGQWDVYTVDPDGGGLRTVTDDDPAASDTDASWSPDGHFIVYSSDRGGLPRPSIFAIPAVGGEPVPVTYDMNAADGAPSWSPDGRWIAFESHMDDDAPAALRLVAAPPVNACAWPDWACTARLAGAAFELDMSEAEIDAKLQQAADEGVSVLVADAPTGWSYTAWVDTSEFNQVLGFMRDSVFPAAHAKGLKVVWYLTGLELVCESCVKRGRDPAAEHSDWMQIDREGNTVQFAGVEDIFWLEEDDLDAWLSPESPYRDFYIDRIEDIAACGADGLWIDVIYLLNAIGQFDDLWPSHDPYSQAAFRAAYGHATIPSKDWDDLTWRHFVRWRIESITRFVEGVFAAARVIDPDLVFFTENWGMDSNFVTQYAQDPLEFIANPHVATAHELEPVDQEGSGMGNATMKQWRDYALMVKFGVAANKDKPAWVLTYAGAIDDSLREAGVHLAEGANFYEAKGPEMLDDSTGSRPIVFAWLAENGGLVYHGASMAEVALWYSPRTRDFLDGETAGDDKFDYAETTYIKEYRERAHDLLEAQMPFDIVTGQWSAVELARYTWLVLPNAACMSDAEAALLRDYVTGGGKLAVTGDTGSMDEWCLSRRANALSGLTTYPFVAVASDVVTTDLSAPDKGRVLVGVRTGTDADGSVIVAVLANFDRTQSYSDLGISVRLPPGFSPTAAQWSAPGVSGGTLDCNANGGRVSVTLPVLDTAAAVVIRGTGPSPGPTVTPTGTVAPPTDVLLLPVILKDYR